MSRYNLTSSAGSHQATKVPLIHGVAIPLFIISFLLWILRIYTRCRPMKLWWDDFFISLAMLFSIASFAICMAEVAVGYGQHTATLSPENVVNYAHLALVAEPLWVFEQTFIKMSVACMFLRFTRTVTWKVTWKLIMYFTLFYLVASSIIVLALQLTECRPLRFFWDPTVPGGHCRSPNEVRAAIIGTSIVFLLSDFELSLLPMTFIFTLNRPMKERIAVASLMGLGLVASVVGCLKFVEFKNYDQTSDPTYAMVSANIGAFAEAKIGMIAANMPPLKAFAQHMIGKLGSNKQTSKATSTGIPNSGEASRQPSNQELLIG